MPPAYSMSSGSSSTIRTFRLTTDCANRSPDTMEVGRRQRNSCNESRRSCRSLCLKLRLGDPRGAPAPDPDGVQVAGDEPGGGQCDHPRGTSHVQGEDEDDQDDTDQVHGQLRTPAVAMGETGTAEQRPEEAGEDRDGVVADDLLIVSARSADQDHGGPEHQQDAPRWDVKPV